MSTPVSGTPAPVSGSDNASMGQLVGEITNDLSTLVRDEMALAKVEIQQSVADAGKSAGLFGAAGIVALYGVGALIATFILLLALVLPAWAAALIVTVVLFVIAAVAGLIGKKKAEQISPPIDKAKAGIAKDLDTVKGNRS